MVCADATSLAYVLGDLNSGVFDGGNAIPDEYLTAVAEARIRKTSSS